MPILPRNETQSSDISNEIWTLSGRWIRPTYIYICISIPWIQNLGRMNIQRGSNHKTKNTHTGKIHITKLKLPLKPYTFNRKVMLLTYNI